MALQGARHSTPNVSNPPNASKPTSDSQYSFTYAEEIRLKEKANQERNINKENKEARRARELRTRINEEHFACISDKARRAKEIKERREGQVKEDRKTGASWKSPLTSNLRMSGP